MSALYTNLDEIDLKIMDLLQEDARLTNAAIAASVGLTPPSVFERIRKLEQRGIIRGYRAVLDPASLSKALTAFIRLTVAADEKYEVGLEAIQQDADILEAYHVAGEDCIILKTKVGDPHDLEGLLNRLQRWFTVQRSVTMIALSAIKEGGRLKVLA